MTVATVLGTFNRRSMLLDCLAAVRRAAGRLDHVFVPVDGGSTDGTLDLLRGQPDVLLVEQGELLGAVRAYNAGFARALERADVDSIFIVNDDDEVLPSPRGPVLEVAHRILEEDPRVGAVALESDLRGEWACEGLWGMPLLNKGLVRRTAGEAAARLLGDPTGRAWWGSTHHTYAADMELGLAMKVLGFEVVRGVDLRVHDRAPFDDLRLRNAAAYNPAGNACDCGGPGGVLRPIVGTGEHATSAAFWERWPNAESCAYDRAAAERFGGVLR